MPQVGCFDTAFHHDQPELARLFAPPLIYRREGVQRYGFHGLSYEYIAGALAEIMGTPATAVVAHLGNGASMCAMRDGQSVASTMGFTAVEGLPMGTRTGSLTPGVLLYLIERHGMGAKDLTNLLCVTVRPVGTGGQQRHARIAGQPRSQRELAVDYFCYRIALEPRSLAAALGGLDALVFTGASASTRQRCASRSASVRPGWASNWTPRQRRRWPADRPGRKRWR
ncbi:MAG: hypothetical protein U1F59_04115 [Candidatus Competibacteraceae bacterium]